MTRMDKQTEKQNGKTKMDSTLDDSFPASDPPSWSSPKDHGNAGKDLKTQKKETKGRPEEVHQSFTKDDFMSSDERTTH